VTRSGVFVFAHFESRLHLAPVVLLPKSIPYVIVRVIAMVN